MAGAVWEPVVRLLDEAVGAGRVCPAAAILVARGSGIVFEYGAGVTGAAAALRPCDEESIFDVASLTKPLVTTALVLDFVHRGRLHFDTRVVQVLPEFGDGEDARRRSVTVRHLLHHDSGLPAYRRFFESVAAPATARRAGATARDSAGRDRILGLALAEPLEREPGTESVYSDIGYLVLGAMLERIAEERIDRLATERLFDPLGLGDAYYVENDEPAPASLARVAATGVCEWRGFEVHGVVQDENAYAMGGVAPHAGLFATARAVHRLTLEWVEAALGGGRVLASRLVRHAWRTTSGAAPSTWALGWDTPSAAASTAGSRVGRPAVGHLGYTGTSVWVDRSRRAHVVLLTNRIACGRSSDAFRKLRPRVHDAVFAALDARRT